MITEDRLKYFLSTNYNNLKEGDYHFLVDTYFKSHDKTWYIDNDEKESLKLDKKEAIFWQLIRQHAMPFSEENEYFDFSGFIFPEFEERNHLYKTNRRLIFPENFWEKDTTKVFKYAADFRSAKFLGSTYFKNTQFLGKADFMFSKFLGKVNFIEAIFLGDTIFLDVLFSEKVYFHSTQFSKTHDTLFHECYRTENEIKEARGIYSIADRNIYFDFTNVELHNKIIFRRIHFHNTNFYITNITKEVRFEECKWDGNYRLKLFKKEKGFFKKDIYEDYQERYRQLKLNYANFQEWNTSGKAYRSEMYAKQWLTFFEIFNYKKWFAIPVRIIEFLMSAFYGLFSGYTQSITKPFVWLIVSTVFIFPLFYNNCSLIEIFTCNYFDKLKLSAENTFPFFKFNSDSNSYFWVTFTQKIFSSTLLAFFILALRKRFKQ